MWERIAEVVERWGKGPVPAPELTRGSRGIPIPRDIVARAGPRRAAPRGPGWRCPARVWQVDVEGPAALFGRLIVEGGGSSVTAASELLPVLVPARLTQRRIDSVDGSTADELDHPGLRV